jgi:hypothetical protein
LAGAKDDELNMFFNVNFAGRDKEARGPFSYKKIERILAHLLSLCGGDSDAFEYLLDWLSWPTQVWTDR